MGLATIRLWSDEECARVHEATLRVLASCGVEVRYGPALRYFIQMGARVDGTRVRLNATLVDDALATAPHSWAVRSRGREEVLLLEDGNVYFGTGSDCLYIADPETGERRRAKMADVEGLAVLCESLPNVNFVMSMVSPEDVLPEQEVLLQHEAMLKGTRKPLLVTPRDGSQLARMVAMAEACGDGQSLIVYGMPSPPLMHDEFALTKIIESARLSVPLVYSPAPTVATTAPASVAAVAVIANAEVLSGLVLHQAVNPGAPFVYGTGCDVFDMRTMINPYVTPGWCQGGQAGCDLAHYYGLPSFSYAGFSDSKLLDEQWAAEAAMTAIIGGLSRSTLLHDVGYLESGLQTSYESIVFGDEMVGFVRSLLSEVTTDDESLAVDEIIAVGPGGHHLGRAYTRAHYRRFWTPTLLDTAAHDRWAASGGLTLGQRVRARIAELRRAEPAFIHDDSTLRELNGLATRAVDGPAASPTRGP
jgi:trimethylamine---corrinoid protein Co-methyltransferase